MGKLIQIIFNSRFSRNIVQTLLILFHCLQIHSSSSLGLDGDLPQLSFIRVIFIILKLSMKGPIVPIVFIFIFRLGAQAQSGCGQDKLSEEELVGLSVQCFTQKYNPQQHDGHKLSQIVDGRLAKYRRILQHLKMHKVKHIETSPVVKWAQNKEKIFINFKLSHRQDSPPCSDIRNQKFLIENVDKVEGKLQIAQREGEGMNTSIIDFESQCFFTNQKFRFKLHMSFNNTLKAILIDREGLGTYTMVGEKKEAEIWIDPFEDVHRAAIWPEMRERFSSDMNEYFEMRERRMEEKEQKNKRKRRKRPGKQAEKKDEEQEQL